jgi:hypothetical protein
METTNNTEKWVVIGLIGTGLAVFGYMAFNKQRAARFAETSGPIAVAAVRGGAGGVESHNLSPAEVAGDYVKTLQDDQAVARKNAKKYEDAAKAREDELNKVKY